MHEKQPDIKKLSSSVENFTMTLFQANFNSD